MTTKAALYLRVSTPDQAEKFSLPAQRRALVGYCEREGWAYIIYEDAGISGETIEARPQMRRLLQDAAAGKFEIALAVEMERFSRSRDGADLAVIKRVFRESAIRFGTPAQLFNPEDVEDDFISSLLGLLASREKQ
jgi:site-specific DNA recombinase